MGAPLGLPGGAGGALVARSRLPARDSSLAHWLVPPPLIQSTDPRLQAQARLIIGREQDAATPARRPATWVPAPVARRATPAVPSALPGLGGRGGGCNGPPGLFVGLAA